MISIASRHKRRWTPTEDGELRGRVGWQSLASIARQLGRTVFAVDVRCARLHLSVSPKCHSARAVGQRLDVDSKLVAWWIAQGWLRARRSATRAGAHQRWEIDGEAIVGFLQAHPDRYDARRIPDPYLRRVASQAQAGAEYLTAEQAARQLGVHPKTLGHHLRQGWVPGVRVVGAGGEHWRIRAADLGQFRRRRPAVRMVYRKGHSGAVRKAAS